MCLVPQALHLVPQFLWLPPRGQPLITWLWWPRVTCIPGSHRTVTIRGSSWQASTLRELHGQQTETWAQPFHEKCLFASPGASAWGARLQLWHISRGYRSSLREHRPMDAILCSYSWQLTGISQKESWYTCLELWFCSCCPEDTSKLSDSLGQWGLSLWCHRTVYIYIL